MTERAVTRAGRVRVLASLDELLDELQERRPFKTSDSLSGSRFESARYRGAPVVLKYLCVDDDWIMRATGDIDCRVLRLLSSDIGDRLPATIDDATVAVAPYVAASGHRGAALLLREVGAKLVAPGSIPISLEQHLRFIEHMADLHATFWDWEDGVGLIPFAHHYTFLTPAMAELEAQRGASDPVPKAVGRGWHELRQSRTELAATLHALADDPGPLVSALRATPQTFVHADWKLGNLGEHDDGRTILLDWDRCGAAPATLDLAWYLAVNCDRLPHSKEDTIAAYRRALESRGIATADWWEVQLKLSLLGAALQLAWSKLGDPAELDWWEERVSEGARHLA